MIDHLNCFDVTSIAFVRTFLIYSHFDFHSCVKLTLCQVASTFLSHRRHHAGSLFVPASGHSVSQRRHLLPVLHNHEHVFPLDIFWDITAELYFNIPIEHEMPCKNMLIGPGFESYSS